MQRGSLSLYPTSLVALSNPHGIPEGIRDKTGRWQWRGDHFARSWTWRVDEVSCFHSRLMIGTNYRVQYGELHNGLAFHGCERNVS